ncbi:hypothetical protein [Micromonospora sp. WMMD1082]|uniref:hypothetical protein n=1 Tax=Micromonospora sp. WMMD1082 TaxID=3016104 RepID=UPI0024174938|nr:hypothetical protein [Micromonospora sp. WMMD1082]MDG4795211.1 hypothetical protein [Micromonospora sp. WMMD1082]
MITDAEHMLLDYVRGYADLIDASNQIADGWRHATSFHLLLASGRLFTPGPLPRGLGKMRDRFCFINAATAARRSHGLLYAEGIASFTVRGQPLSVPHAWCAATDGTAVDPTWDAGMGVAYLGIAITDASLWPTSNGGLFDDHRQSAPVLRDGFTPGATAALGRALPLHQERA